MLGEDAFPEPLEVGVELGTYFVALWAILATCLVVEWGVAGSALSSWIALLVAGGDAP